ncbi:MAG: CBS domain-containing protein [Chromatiales bacterium]
METVAQLLEDKGSVVWTIRPDASVFEAIEMMAEKGIGALVVVEANTIVGLVSERDYARSVVLKGRASRATPIREIMTRRVICARPEQSIKECMALMTDKRVRHLPVVDGDRLCGLVSIGDLVKAIIIEQQFIIEQLEHYISSG